MSNKKLKLQISTPEREFFNEEVDMVVVKSITGEMGILPRHLPIVTVLDIGTVKIKQGNTEKKASLNGGFMEIKDSNVIILTDSAEWPEEIDVDRAQKAKQRAEERIRCKRVSDTDMARAEMALKKAINRMKVGER